MKHSPRKAKALSRRGFISAAAGLIALAPFARGRAAAILKPGGPLACLDLPGASSVKILALTDLHFFAKTAFHDQRTLRDVKAMIAAAQPDLILTCGDVWFENVLHLGEKHCRWVCEQIGALGVPWAYVRGNHDDADDFAVCAAAIAAAPNSLYAGGLDADYVVEVGPAGAPIVNLIILNDANPDLGFSLATQMHFETLAQLIRSRQPQPALGLAFFHVPLPQLGDLADAGQARGVNGEKSFPENYDLASTQALLHSGLVAGVFSGHDHKNNYYGTVDGVGIEYIRATGYGGYGNHTVPKGGTLITAAAGGYTTATILPSGQMTPQQEKR
jgi:hypothetical protein